MGIHFLTRREYNHGRVGEVSPLTPLGAVTGPLIDGEIKYGQRGPQGRKSR